LDLYLQSVDAAVPYSVAFDSNNYMPWCSVYTEDTKMLPKTSDCTQDPLSPRLYSSVVQKDSAPVHLAFNTIQLTRCKTLIFLSSRAMAPSSELNSTDYEI